MDNALFIEKKKEVELLRELNANIAIISKDIKEIKNDI